MQRPGDWPWDPFQEMERLWRAPFSAFPSLFDHYRDGEYKRLGLFMGVHHLSYFTLHATRGTLHVVCMQVARSAFLSSSTQC